MYIGKPGTTTLDHVLDRFDIRHDSISIMPIHQGLINTTWKILAGDQYYILQKINENVFRSPEDISQNIVSIGAYLNNTCPGYLFAGLIRLKGSNEVLYKTDEGCFRLFTYIIDSHTIDVVSTPLQAFEAARQFGRFTAVLKEFDCHKLNIPIPGFHDLTIRYKDFLLATRNGNKERIKESSGLIRQLRSWSHITEQYEKIKRNPEFKLRVTHHDTKISNILFDKEYKGLCVIDLDTVMPGYFISDLGDMFRTYLSPVSEEDNDLSKIEIRPEIYAEIKNGYFHEMQDELTAAEKDSFLYAGDFMIYMQALRFMSDHLMDDSYYPTSYPGQNLQRARNQAVLLEKWMKFRNEVVDK